MIKIKLILITTLFLASTSSYAGLVIYPANDQSPEQQQKDEGECHTWAISNSDYDPANPPVAAAPEQTSGHTGSRLRGAARGALIAEVADGDAGKGAVAGAVAGGSRERRSQRKAGNEAQASADQAQQAGLNEYNKARSACLEGRGYSVK
ncbi:MAG: hypothetical protein L3J24_12410 [Xanthomonadales bacterium]|nr:hypothetical protein [Xanthomonadales bacterium]